MATRTRRLEVVIAGDTRGAERALDRLERRSSGFGSRFAKIGKTVGVGLAAVGVGAVALGKSFVDAAIESQKATKQTAAVIKSMGGVSNVTAGQVAKLSEKLSMQSGIDDELIQSGQNVLLTFGKVRNEVGKGNDIFTRATKNALDMSVALGTDLKAANIQVGKALNDPIKGITALSRAGVSFSQKQKDTIKRLVETGDTLGAQKIILSELDKQFGGSAKAQATAGERLKVVWGNLQERIGEKLLPIVEKVATFLADNLPKALDRAKEAFDKVRPVVERLVKKVLAGLAGWWEDNGPKIIATIKLIRDWIKRLATGVKNSVEFIVRNWKTIFPILKTTAVIITTILIPHWIALKVQAGIAAAKVAASWVVTHVAALKAAAIHSAQIVVMVAKWVFLGVQSLLHAAKVAAAWLIAMGPIALVIAAVVGLTVVVVKNWDKIKRVITGAVNAVLGFLRRNWPLILAIITGPVGLAVLALVRHWDKIKGGVRAVVQFVKDRFNGVVDFFRKLPGRLGNIGAGMFDFIKDAFRSAVNFIIRAWNGLEFKIPGFDPPGPGPKFGGITIGVPNIPELAQGAIVRHRPGGVLARIAEGRNDEAVVPLPDGLAAIAKTGGAPIVIHVHLEGSVGVDGPAVRKWVAQGVKEFVRTNGSLPGTNVVRTA